MVRPPDKAKPCLPRALRRHVLFGWKFYEKHQFKADKWALTLLTQQFRCMIDLLLKHIEYKNLSKKSTIDKQKRLLAQLQKVCKDGRSKLKEGLYGNCQKIKNLLHHNREMQRLYQNMTSNLVVENIDQRTFIERKERDKLQYRRDQLLKQYEEKMIEISELEDKATYADIYIIPEENLVKKYRKELTDAQTRLKAAKNILLAYRKIIDTLHEDAIYYEPVLDSLQLDVEEQANFISQVINMGLPAMSNLQILTAQYNKLEEETRKAMQSKMELLAVFRKRGGEQVKEIAQMFKAADERNSQLRVYRRETQSMTNLKEHMEKIEKNILEVKNAVLAPGATSIFPLMKKQIKKNAILKKELDFRDREMETLESIDTQAKLMNDLLKYNLTDEEIERKNTIKTLKTDIETQKKLKDEYEIEIHDKGDIFAYLRFSLQHLLDVLNNIGDPLPVPIRRYPAQDLKLPLLRFDARVQEHYPPDPFEENAEKLLLLAKKRVGEIMSPFKEAAAAAIEASRAKYHADFAEAFSVETVPTVAGEEANPFEDSLIGEKDLGVPSRKQIKTISAQIVEANMKKDDQ